MTLAEADLVESAELIAVTVYVPAVEGAVYRPPLVTIPPDVFQVTAVLVVPLTEAANCFCCVGCKEAAVGDTVTDTVVAGPPEPNMETMHVEYREPGHQLVGKEVRVVCSLVSE